MCMPSFIYYRGWINFTVLLRPTRSLRFGGVRRLRRQEAGAGRTRPEGEVSGWFFSVVTSPRVAPVTPHICSGQSKAILPLSKKSEPRLCCSFLCTSPDKRFWRVWWNIKIKRHDGVQRGAGKNASPPLRFLVGLVCICWQFTGDRVCVWPNVEFQLSLNS